MEQGLEDREPAPEFNLLAAGSARRISLKEASGHSLVLIFHPQGTAPTAREINRADYGGLVSRHFGARNTGRAAIVIADDDSNIVGVPGRAARGGRSGDVGYPVGYP